MPVSKAFYTSCSIKNILHFQYLFCNPIIIPSLFIERYEHWAGLRLLRCKFELRIFIIPEYQKWAWLNGVLYKTDSKRKYNTVSIARTEVRGKLLNYWNCRRVLFSQFLKRNCFLKVLKSISSRLLKNLARISHIDASPRKTWQESRNVIEDVRILARLRKRWHYPLKSRLRKIYLDPENCTGDRKNWLDLPQNKRLSGQRHTKNRGLFPENKVGFWKNQAIDSDFTRDLEIYHPPGPKFDPPP